MGKPGKEYSIKGTPPSPKILIFLKIANIKNIYNLYII